VRARRLSKLLLEAQRNLDDGMIVLGAMGKPEFATKLEGLIEKIDEIFAELELPDIDE
jgi:hypothetical protein